MLIKAFDVILDPRLKLEDVSFKSKASETYLTTSPCRRGKRLAHSSSKTAQGDSSETHSYIIPRITVGLVCCGQDDGGYHWASLGQEDGLAGRCCGPALHVMHPPDIDAHPTQCASEQSRCSVPYHQIDRFLLKYLRFQNNSDQTVLFYLDAVSDLAAIQVFC